MIYKKSKEVRLSDIIIPKFQPVINDIEHSHFILDTGRAGTKSSFLGILSDYLIVAEPNTAIVIMRKHHNKLSKTVYKEALRALNRLHLDKSLFKITKTPMQITYLANGNTIYFTGSDSIDDTKGIIDENHSIKLVALDELTEFFDKGEGEDEISNITATFVRGNNESFRMIYLFNSPRNPKAPIMEWVNKMKKRNDVVHIHADYRDVPVEWLGKKLIEEAEAMKKVDEKMYNWVWLGLCTGIDELIYYMFDEKKHVKEITKEQLKHIRFIGCGVDYGHMNATTYEFFGMDFVDKCIRGIDEYYHSGRESGKQRSPSEYARDFKKAKERVEKSTKKKVLFVFIDPSAKGLAEEIKRVCPEVKILDADNSVLLGINRVQKLMSLGHLFISPKQKHLIEEEYQYEWDEDLLDKGKEVPVKEHDHCQDAKRYLVMGFWKYIRQLLPLLEKEEDVEYDEQ